MLDLDPFRRKTNLISKKKKNYSFFEVLNKGSTFLFCNTPYDCSFYLLYYQIRFEFRFWPSCFKCKCPTFKWFLRKIKIHIMLISKNGLYEKDLWLFCLRSFIFNPFSFVWLHWALWLLSCKYKDNGEHYIVLFFNCVLNKSRNYMIS